MKNQRPIVGITMGDPTGIGPEILLLALCDPLLYDLCKPLVIGDRKILEKAKICAKSGLDLKGVQAPDAGTYRCGCVDILISSDLDHNKVLWGKPTVETGKAMVGYVAKAADMAVSGKIAAVVTCPINKMAMQMAGFHYNGHTELLAERTKTDDFAMMLAGDKLRVVLVTIHIPLKDVADRISKERVCHTIKITGRSLYERFGIENPHIAVAALNPHAGEGGMFGDEEMRIISPAIDMAREEGFHVSGPFPPDTLFYHAIKGCYDAVVCMYHDQGLIPFKMIHFTDGVNTTLGLPIIRTSVDHGTAYDIAGTGRADPGSLVAAIKMAAKQAKWADRRRT